MMPSGCFTMQKIDWVSVEIVHVSFSVFFIVLMEDFVPDAQKSESSLDSKMQKMKL